MSIVMPAILFWLIVLVIYWLVCIILDYGVPGYNILNILAPMYILGVIGTIVYVIYALIWLSTNWITFNFHIHLT